MIFHMDSIDARILEILQANGRISMQQLAREINMSSPAATDRVKKLEDAGVIKGYTAVIDPEKLGLPVHAYMTATVTAESRRKFYEYINNCPSVITTYFTITGGAEVVMDIYAAGTDEVGRIQKDLFDLAMTTTNIVINEAVKESPFRPRKIVD